MRLLITGAFGYLGGRLAQYLNGNGIFDVRLGTRKAPVSPPWLQSSAVVQIDWQSTELLAQACSDTDVVIQAAGMNAKDCEKSPEGALEVNGHNTARLLDAAIACGVKRFVYVSTAHVYASPLSGVITELTKTSNPHPYATSHLAGEDAVLSAHRQGLIEGVVVRLSNAFGAPAHNDVQCWTLLVNDICRSAVVRNEIILHSSGQQARNFIAMKDVCRVFFHLMRLRRDQLGNGIFNLGSHWNPTVMEVAYKVRDRVSLLTNKRPEISSLIGDIDSEIHRLDYRSQRLASTGFAECIPGSIDDEIDQLIRFCIEDKAPCQ